MLASPPHIQECEHYVQIGCLRRRWQSVGIGWRMTMYRSDMLMTAYDMGAAGWRALRKGSFESQWQLIQARESRIYAAGC